MLRSAVLVLLVPTVAFGQLEERAALVKKQTQAALLSAKESLLREESLLPRYKKGILDKNAGGTVITANEKVPIRFSSKNAKFNTIAQTEKTIEALNQIISEYESGNRFYYGTLRSEKLKVGTIGKLTNSRVKVFQVIDESTMLVQAFFPGENNRMASEKIIVRIRNVNTKDATDGREFDLPQVFEIADTSTYKTATGSNTVFLLEPLNVEAIEAILKK